MTCEMPIVASEKLVKSRKTHRCCECRRLLAVGTRYVRANGIWPGSAANYAASYATCQRCERVKGLALRKYPPVYPEEGPAFGMLRDWISDTR